MPILDVILQRRSRRAYEPGRPVDRQTLRRLVEAAHLAPSYGNKQSWRWVVVDRAPTLDAVRAALSEGNYWALRAPALAVLVSSEAYAPTETHNRPYWALNAALSAMNFMLQATAEGLVAHPMAGFDPPAVKAALGIPEIHVVLLVISVGYPGDPSVLRPHHLQSETSDRVRIPLERVLAFDRWDPALEPGS